MFSAVGTLVKKGDATFVYTELGQSGSALYGPYEEYGPGRYMAKFHVEIPLSFERPNDTVCCVLDVATDAGGFVIEQTNIFIFQIKRGQQDFFLVFNLAQPAKLEFRVWSLGYAPLLISCDREVRAMGPDIGAFSPVLAPEQKPVNRFFQENFSQFRALHERGVTISAYE